MKRLRILIRMESADAFELKAQALNNDSRLKDAGISALKFIGDKKYIADGEFSHELPSPSAPEPATEKNKSAPTPGKGLRVVLRMPNEDTYELKAQALNDHPRLKDAGIAALKFVGDKHFIANGEFSTDRPPADSREPKLKTIGKKLQVVVRMSDKDAYELKAQALNSDPRLKEAGIDALKFVGDKHYISEGEFLADLPSTTHKKVRVTLRAPRKDAYDLVAKHLNNDPALIKAGISGVELAKGAGMVPVPKETPIQPKKKKRSFLRFAVGAAILGLIGVIGVVGLIGVTGVGALFFANLPAPTSTTVAQIPVSGKPTETATLSPATETNVPPTNTRVPSTKTQQPPTPTNTRTPIATVVSCLPPSEVVVAAENLSCRYGPGASYLYRTGLSGGDIVDVLGKSDTAFGTWIRVQTRWEVPVKCWVNSGPNFVEIPQGDVACLDPLYPEKAPLIIFNTDLFPKPSNVEASRSEDIVYIDWQGFDLLPGDLPEASPPYLVETWTCQGGEIVFSPQGWDDTSAWVRDEGGCDQASYGYVYMAHVDGYIGPVTIPWPE